MNHHHRDLRVRTSLQPHLGRSPTEPEEIERLVRAARAAGVIVFLKAELERLPWQVQEIIEGEHKRICERSGR
jgi:hypothetical protein